MNARSDKLFAEPSRGDWRGPQREVSARDLPSRNTFIQRRFRRKREVGRLKCESRQKLQVCQAPLKLFFLFFLVVSKTLFIFAQSQASSFVGGGRYFAMNEQSNDIMQELALLHTLSGADFSRQVEKIAQRAEFYPLERESGIYVCGGERQEDYDNLVKAARKAVAHSYEVYILPNPGNIRTADFILVRKGTYRLYDLKTILGKNSALNRLVESIGQSNRILLNITTLARCIKRYFEYNKNALEVLVFKAGKSISVSRELSQSKAFYKIFMKKYTK